MKLFQISALVTSAFMLSACTEGVIAGLSGEGGRGRVKTDKTFDYGQGQGEEEHLSNLVAGIWVDPNGCDHWIIDDGIEGYLSERLTPDGRPVCSGVAPPSTVVGPFQSGSDIADPL